MIEQLKNIVGENAVSEKGEELSKFEVAGKMPAAIVFPTTVEQISKILKLARRERKKISIFGNNSLSNFGATIESFDIGISLNRMNKILSHEVADLTVSVEAGMNLANLQRSLASKKQFLPLDPILAERRTLGGIVAANSSGSLRLRYGVCRDLALGMKIVQPDGTIIRTGGKTVKNVAGYDLSKLFIGSMGTLGVIAEITFKLFPLPVDSQTLCAGFDSFEKIPDLARAICSSKLVISQCEYFNRVFASQNFSDRTEMTFPNMLVINIQGHSEMVATTISKIHEIAGNMGANSIQVLADKNDAKFWDQFHHGNSNGAPLHLQISVPRSRFGNIVKSVAQFAEKMEHPIALQSHVGNGIINLFWDSSAQRNENQIEHWRTAIFTFRQFAKSNDGTLTIQHAPIELRIPDLVWGEPNKNFPLMKSIKSNYDPHQIIAAGRFVGGL